ncbi:response regulator [Gemmata sp. G18]|uniref:Response regulator n=1 Tax=Gemmata palustris TaxID=2822762 RepID=A0ABS5BQB0_9BACT|nr:response regulator [Gemmata palustris]MBP3955892.1 response regulator [Gemmata palustris]
MLPPDDQPSESDRIALRDPARSVFQVATGALWPAHAHGPFVSGALEDDPHHPLRVMVVDDNVDAADALAALTEVLGCETRICYGGVAALKALAEEVPDVLLLDLSMPEVNGLEVAARARALAGRRMFLLVATTALGDWEDRTATALAGFHFHLVKPVDMTTLRSALDRFRAVRGESPLLSPGSTPDTRPV